MEHAPRSNLFLTVVKTILLIAFLATLLLVYSFIRYKNLGENLVQVGNWSHFPGATVTKQGVHFQPLNRVIIHQDGSVGQPNPAVNIAGEHLVVKGGFDITFGLVSIDKQASFRLYASPPMVYDQWRYETPSIDTTVDAAKSTVTTRIWDGSSSSSVDMRTFSISLQPEVIISLEHVGDKISIFQNGQLLGDMPDHNIFANDTIWFGADAVPQSTGWTLATLRVKAIGAGNVAVVQPPSMVVNNNDSNSLRSLAKANSREIKIGTAVADAPLFTDQQYRDVVFSQFSIVTPENVMKPQFIHPQPDVYDFVAADQLVDAALSNNTAVHGHALVYAKSSPDWMAKSKAADRQQIMVDHITNVASHFKGKVAEWDVVNEPFSEKHALYGLGKSGLDQNIWFEAMGEKYIDLAFEAAHKADPAAKLYLNDYGIERDGQHWDALLALVKRLKNRGVPIDGVGFEAHVYTDGDYFDASQLKQHMKALADLGLLTRISEIDVTGDDAKEQINQYATALDVCLRAPNCTSYTTWGVTDKYGSTTRSDRYPLVYGTSLLWGSDMKPKPAYSALQNRLRQR